MYARATQFAITSRAIQYSTAQGSNILRLQDQISSGLKITRPSDQPSAWQQISAFSLRLASIEATGPVITDATARLNASVSELQEAHRLTAAAERLAQQGIQSMGPTERAALATEAEGLLYRMKNLANTRYGQHYLYGGTRSSTQPFDFEPPTVAGRLAATLYSGGDRHGQSVISTGLSVDSLYRGDEVFDVDDRQETVLISNSGVGRAVGTDSMRGRATLAVRHTVTSYAAGSGVAAAANSPGNDTILGPSGTHRLTINDTSGTGASGTISLNGGSPIAFDSSQASLEVIGPLGEKVFVNMTAITAGFSGDVDITANGTLSLDGGSTTVPIGFAAQQSLTDPLGGGQVRLDTSTIRRPGDDYLEFPGTTDIFATLDSLIRDLRGERNLDAAATNESLGRTLERLDSIADRMLETIGVQSSSLAGLDQIQSRNEDLKLELEIGRSNLQSTDLPTAIIDLQSEQLLQQYTFAITSRIMSQNLLSFLQ